MTANAAATHNVARGMALCLSMEGVLEERVIRTRMASIEPERGAVQDARYALARTSFSTARR
jgi:hypothetical protein